MNAKLKKVWFTAALALVLSVMAIFVVVTPQRVSAQGAGVFVDFTTTGDTPPVETAGFTSTQKSTGIT